MCCLTPLSFQLKILLLSVSFEIALSLPIRFQIRTTKNISITLKKVFHFCSYSTSRFGNICFFFNFSLSVIGSCKPILCRGQRYMNKLVAETPFISVLGHNLCYYMLLWREIYVWFWMVSMILDEPLALFLSWH